MKKIIDGKLYDTATAKKIAEWDNGRCGTFWEECETLYRTPKGTYFLHGWGGPMSRYKVLCESNSWSGSEDFRVMAGEDLRAWLEEKADADTYLAVIGAAEEA